MSFYKFVMKKKPVIHSLRRWTMLWFSIVCGYRGDDVSFFETFICFAGGIDGLCHMVSR